MLHTPPGWRSAQEVLPLAAGTFKTLERRKLVEQVAEQIRDQIVSGALPAGTALIQEELAERLGVSRTPLREAFRVLERDGLIQPSPTSHTSIVVEFGDDDVREFFEIRQVIDALAARLAASRPQPKATIDRLETHVRRMLDSVDPLRIERFLPSHVAFHIGVLQAAGNSHLLQFENIVRVSAYMLYPKLGLDPQRMATSANEHREILDAIEAGDVPRAQRLSDEHIENTLRTWSNRTQASVD